MQVKIEVLTVNEQQGRMTKSSQGRENNIIYKVNICFKINPHLLSFTWKDSAIYLHIFF